MAGLVTVAWWASEGQRTIDDRLSNIEADHPHSVQTSLTERDRLSEMTFVCTLTIDYRPVTVECRVEFDPMVTFGGGDDE